jgi:hypothetical protein
VCANPLAILVVTVLRREETAAAQCQRDYEEGSVNILKMVPKHSVCKSELLIRFFFLTDDHQLLLRGYCPKCKVGNVELYLSLTDLYKDCPDPPMGFTILDIAMLKHDFHILLNPAALLPEPPCSPQ